jgi:hypothetical protein
MIGGVAGGGVLRALRIIDVIRPDRRFAGIPVAAKIRRNDAVTPRAKRGATLHHVT